ncbi:sensor domain-containing diguanylate cyclase [Altererythrobacter sp. SALINAS58]|uniref:sensor domain-containing diguanylate cyclase n=1 Tax=Alteripontixanthobacter muriae TaxID=2705546 RepID=UPI0015775011|nr:sensor domain-containing diguanylate cyclase [Alteripontixanthobacter muriae]NTZ43842.1 sensor domain-containing diguanylate cyclase [Alteripontixanthobacter muriae]
MTDQNLLLNERAPLSNLQRYNVLDTSPAEAFDKITSLVRSVLKVPIAAVSLIDRGCRWFTSIQGSDSIDSPSLASFGFPLGGERPLVIFDALEDERFSTHALVAGAPHIRSYAGAPLRTSEGHNLGTLCVIDTAPRNFSETELSILSSFASLVVHELELLQIAEQDHLTGALSRRAFFNQIEKETERFRRSDQPSALALMDLDHFKSINDRFGHPAGDAVLTAVARTCAEQLRENDVIGRLGGEEFGILLSGTDEAGGRAAIEKIRRSIEEQVIPLGGGIRVTASFGMAVLDAEDCSGTDWIDKADKALYSAKRCGRNCCVSALHRAQPDDEGLSDLLHRRTSASAIPASPLPPGAQRKELHQEPLHARASECLEDFLGHRRHPYGRPQKKTAFQLLSFEVGARFLVNDARLDPACIS